ncbi:hypothetical protein I7I50_04232 [Histoplasma capsulatum G186AR]|uniref:Uncharacterized protein n=1 Tax=Ajellomyces capsulatus TaxID=5037 RepID=A0A8H7YQD0_AJECA|nr:hypothetical protein I7I52_05140 [Histoplasma capsulatum]QSS75181.1 hypothetical protein I7I50_04232 [Histoplasma capsulatum G186AR]
MQGDSLDSDIHRRATILRPRNAAHYILVWLGSSPTDCCHGDASRVQFKNKSGIPILLRNLPISKGWIRRVTNNQFFFFFVVCDVRSFA